MGERVGMFGGTFDPPHIGHIVVAANARHDLGLDRVLIVPAGVPWQKVGTRPITPAEARLDMLRAAFAGIEGCDIVTDELDRPGESYTVDTVEQLQAAHPDLHVYLFVGSDIAPQLDTWKRPERLRELVTVATYDRPGHLGGRPPKDWRTVVIDIPLLDVSSTDIRSRVRAGRPIEGLVPNAVAERIRAERLYLEAAA